jgi:class 3 adenylate cyclase
VASPPTGTVTFLFTDIEGSTKLWESHPAAMQTALARHDEILRGSTEQHGGYVFKTMGTLSVVPSRLPLMLSKPPWKPSVGYSLPNGKRPNPLG